MFVRTLFLFFLGIIAVIIQMGLVPTFFSPFNLINVILITLIFLFFLADEREKLFFLIIWVGFLIELFGSAPFGLHLLSLFLTFFIVFLISNVFLTNKTFLVLIAISFLVFIFYNLIFVFLVFLISIKYNLNVSYSFLNYLQSGFLGALINLPLIIIINLLVKTASKFFKRNFIFN